ncbi:MAG: hypothetical protein A2287_03345 [Candidatus Melainabacteria bacterium RIFOXYA12_FULL_32_12]|nr:MAG: hypothetical protein A2287_03345 [Candidatus Melainabacteria bacterium RIFOXYA12_FULL_32_12]
MNRVNSIILYILCLLYFGFSPVYAQQTIFNVPSAEITPKGHVLVEPEFQFTPWKPGRNMLNTDYLIVGVGHNTEVGLLLYNVSVPASDNITLAPGFKSVIPVFSKKYPNLELKAIGGTEILVSVQGGEVGNWSFSELNGRIPKLKTRLTGGISVGTKQIFGRNAVSFIGGVEQPVTKHFSIQADWFSGTHSNGFFIPGFAYAFPKNTTLYVGYQIPNNSRCGKSGFVIELAKIF